MAEVSNEREPTPEDYRLRELYPLYYKYLGALADTLYSTNGNGWREMYQERLNEIKTEIDSIENGGMNNGGHL